MNRRHMVESGVWLKHLGPRYGGVPRAYPTEDGRDAHTLLGEICDRAGYLVEISLSGETYRVQLLPLAGKVPLGQPPVRILYMGTDLRNILAHAAHELMLLRSQRYTFTVHTREVPRWVA